MTTALHRPDLGFAGEAIWERLVRPGDRLPSATLLEADLGPIHLDRLRMTGPIVLVFFRYAQSDAGSAMLAAYQRNIDPPPADALRILIRSLLAAPTATPKETTAKKEVAAQFAWTEYEQLMISEAIHRGEVVYNIALRVDPNSLMQAAA